MSKSSDHTFVQFANVTQSFCHTLVKLAYLARVRQKFQETLSCICGVRVMVLHCNGMLCV